MRLLLRQRPFLDRPGSCSVCGTELLVGSREELSASGWIVQRDAAVCSSCKTDGWELPPRAAIPHRHQVEGVRSSTAVNEAGWVPAGAWPPPYEARMAASRIWPRMAAAGLVALLAAGAAGFFAGASGSESDVNVTSASSGPIRITAPSDWEQRPVGTRIPGLSPSVELAPRDQAPAGLVAGEVRSVERLIAGQPAERPVLPELVALPKAVALAYRGLRPGGSSSRLTLYVVPTDRGDIGVACFGRGTDAAPFLNRCEGVASSLVLLDREGISADAVRDSASSLTRTMAELESMRARGRVRLSRADVASGQARASRRLARSYSTAARTLLAPPAAPASEHLYPGVVVGLHKAKAAYTALGSAARRNQPSGFYAARRDIRRAEVALQEALRQARLTFEARRSLPPPD